MIHRVYLHFAFILVVSALATLAQEGQSRVEIGRGQCGSQQFFGYTINCAIPSATSAMTLSVSVVRQISRYRCTKGQSFGLAADNSYLWTTRGCEAEFLITAVTYATATTIGSSTSTAQISTTTTVSTTTPIQTTTRPTTVTTTSPPTTATTITTTATRGWSNAAICGQAASSGFRIIGGTEAEPCEFPWLVMIYDQRLGSLCGGTIIDDRHILTAAHCIKTQNPRTKIVRTARANELLVFSGSSTMPLNGTDVDGLVRNIVTQVIIHENFNHTSLENDIAILTLSSPIQFGSCQKPICMVDGSKSPHQASNCRTMGWGVTSNGPSAEASSQLQYVGVPVVSDASCRAVYGTLSSGNTFCAGSDGRDSCQGDSGGPFTCQETNGRYSIYGVVSAGVQGSCGTSLGIYTKVSAFLSWINSKTQ
ncbi:hypothetical protein BsWGS_16039 [Bradybaena similaris]